MHDTQLPWDCNASTLKIIKQNPAMISSELKWEDGEDQEDDGKIRRILNHGSPAGFIPYHHISYQD